MPLVEWGSRGVGEQVRQLCQQPRSFKDHVSFIVPDYLITGTGHPRAHHERVSLYLGSMVIIWQGKHMTNYKTMTVVSTLVSLRLLSTTSSYCLNCDGDDNDDDDDDDDGLPVSPPSFKRK